MPRSTTNKRALQFGGFLRRRRCVDLKKSLREVAGYGGCAYGTLSELERGLFDPMRLEIAMLLVLSRAYRVKVEAILRRLELLPPWKGGYESEYIDD